MALPPEYPAFAPSPGRFLARSRVAAPAEEAFAWLIRPGAFERQFPPWARVAVRERSGGCRDGGRLVAAVGLLGRRWVAAYQGFEPGRSFTDVQVRGPFAEWVHRHEVKPDGPQACLVCDDIAYRMPFGPLGRLFEGSFQRRLLALMRHRHAVFAEDIPRVARRPLTVAVSGASGLVGSALLPLLLSAGHRVVRLLRPGSRPLGGPDWPAQDVAWDPARGPDPAALDGVEAVVHLAGDNIAAGRWSAAKKARLRASRVEATAALARALAAMRVPPQVLVSASAVGWYGDRGEEELNETSPSGSGFLAGLCRDWEEAVRPAGEAGLRVVCLRIGVVLSPDGGALGRMLPPFALGLGGPLGTGQQWMSWVSIEDAIQAIRFCVENDGLSGPVNVTAPEPVRNADFARALGRALARSAIAPFPAVLARLAFGELADEVLLAGARVRPARLLAAGFRFRHPDVDGALRYCLGGGDP